MKSRCLLLYKFFLGLGIIIFSTVMIVSCHASSENKRVQSEGMADAASYLPKARIYKMSGDCADLVPVTLTSDGRSLVSFPAPSDLSTMSEPIALADGWWLDRRGITPNSKFTTLSYEQYRALKTPPTPKFLIENLSDDCRVTAISELPMSLSEAMNDISAVNRIILNQPERLKSVMSLPVLRLN